MNLTTRSVSNQLSFQGLLLIVAALVLVCTAAVPAAPEPPRVRVTVEAGGICARAATDAVTWLSLRVAGPGGGMAVDRQSETGTVAWTPPAGAADGLYTWEVCAGFGPRNRTRGDNTRAPAKRVRPWRQSGAFTIQNGAIVCPDQKESSLLQRLPSVMQAAIARIMDLLVPPVSAAEVIQGDLIVQGSQCIGYGCNNSENFGLDTLRFREANLRIRFDDTSYTENFPRNDWAILINDSTNGGADYFAVQDATYNTVPFTVRAGAPTNALCVTSCGTHDRDVRVGLGTAVPACALHIVDGNTPTIRLDQPNTQGWGTQVWDVAGHETYFFIRDVTHGSAQPFRIGPGTPSKALCLRTEGAGFGTWEPAAPMELETTGKAAEFLLERTDGASGTVSATETAMRLGSKTDHPLDFVVHDAPAMAIDTTGRVGIGTRTPAEALHVVGNAYVSGNLELGSSRALKENIRPIGATEAMDTLMELRPVRFNYKSDPAEESLGFIAEEVPDLVATNDRNTLSPMDVVAVLAKVAQEQQRTIDALAARVADLESQLKGKTR